MRLLLLVFILSLALVSGCKSVKPVAPAETYTPFVFKPELSQINVPVEMPVKNIETSINQQLAGLLYEDNNVSDDGMAFKVWKKDNITVAVVGEEFRYRVPLKIWLKAGFTVEKFGMTVSDYEETEFALAIKFKTKISIDPNWKVSTTTTSDGYEWIVKPVLDMGIVEIPLTTIVDKVLDSQQDKLSVLVDEQAKKYIDIKKYVEDAWSLMHQPIELSADPPLWIKITPTEVQMSPLMGRAGSIQSSIGFKAYSQMYVGERPEVKISKLPNLKITRDETGDFSISLVSDMSYEYAEQLAKKYLEGQEYEFNDGKKKIKVDNINLYGSNNKLIVKLAISGSINGNIFLSCIPYYDAPSQSIKVKDMDYDFDTKNKLLKSADWLAHGVFIKKMQSSLSFSIKDNLNETKNLVEKSLTNNRVAKNVLINGKLSQLFPKEIVLTPEAIKAVVVAKGTLNVLIDGLE